MALETQELVRVFKYNSVDLLDPGSQFSAEQVKDFYANTYPEIVNAGIEGPEEKDGKMIYTFRRAVGTKGHGMSQRIEALQVAWFKAAAALEAGVREEFPVGKRISYLERGNNRTALVIGHVGHYDETALQVRTDRCGEVVNVRLCQTPRVLGE